MDLERFFIVTQQGVSTRLKKRGCESKSVKNRERDGGRNKARVISRPPQPAKKKKRNPTGDGAPAGGGLNPRLPPPPPPQSMVHGEQRPEASSLGRLAHLRCVALKASVDLVHLTPGHPGPLPLPALIHVSNVGRSVVQTAQGLVDGIVMGVAVADVDEVVRGLIRTAGVGGENLAHSSDGGPESQLGNAAPRKGDIEEPRAPRLHSGPNVDKRLGENSARRAALVALVVQGVRGPVIVHLEEKFRLEILLGLDACKPALLAGICPGE
jgi:hypothetical protein